MKTLGWAFVGLVALASAACGGSSARVIHFARTPGEQIALPDEASVYNTEAGADGVRGDGEKLAADITKELVARGNEPSADGALAGAAAWVLHELNEGNSLNQSQAEDAARRFGFAGVVTTLAAFSLDAENGDAWRTALAKVPNNMPITRYGICVAPSGRTAAVLLGAAELKLASFPRHLAASDSLTLHGEIGPRYRFAHLYLTDPDGKVEERKTDTRQVDAKYAFSAPGKYQLEVMGDGPTGPVIVLNVPLYVGVDEAPITTSSGHVTSPAEGERRMFELLNQSRATAGVHALQPDDELRAIALAHSEDMAEHHFFGHVSPTTGTTEDREKRSGVVVALFGENVAEADSAENAHDGLMQSPGHRANMLRPGFTHVGIAAVKTDEGQLAFTLIFGRRVEPAQLPNASQIEAAFLNLRAKKGLSAPTADPIYRVAVSAGITAYATASKPSSEVAVDATNSALTREVQRTRSSRPAACSVLLDLLDTATLEDVPMLADPGIKRYGLAAHLRKDDHGSRMSVMMLLEGAACR